MCLEFIDSKSKRTTVGYKIVDTDNSGSFFPRYQRIGRAFSEHSWMAEEDYRVKWLAADSPVQERLRTQSYPRSYYQPGFHSYRKLTCAMSFAFLNKGRCRVLKVGIRGVTATGLQGKREVVVSQEIRILREVPCA